ncbi:MAG TPA: hypothetical protein VF187_11060 [Gemmatimonadales bacterium]
MTKDPGWRPEHTLMAATLTLVGALFVAAVVMVAGVMQGRRIEEMVPYGLGITAVGAVAAFLINAWGRKVWHKQRPEWLETQAWRKEFEEKIAKGKPGPREGGDAPQG